MQQTTIAAALAAATAALVPALTAGPAAAAQNPLSGAAFGLTSSALEALTPFGGVPGNVNAPDLNGDGRPDIAVPDFGTDFLSVRINQGNGTFGPVRRYKVGTKPSFIAAGDFNGDGHTDLAVSNAASGDVSVLLGNGDGTLQAARNISLSSAGAYSNGSFSVAAADVNHDGQLDLVTTNSVTNNLSVLLGKGDGTFAPAKTFPIAGASSIGIIPFALSVGDVNGDGNLDAITGGAAGTTVMLGDGKGDFRAVGSNTVGLDIACTQIGDVNEDGHPDVVATGTATLNAQVLLGSGTGAFTPGQDLYAGGIGPQCFSLTDVNHDGHLDIAMVNTASPFGRGVVRVFFGDGHGHFTSDPVTNTYPVQFAPWATATGDFNGDGQTDLAVANSAPPSVTILDGHDDGHFTDAGTYGM